MRPIHSFAELVGALSSLGIAHRILDDLQAVELSVQRLPLVTTLNVIWDRRVALIQIVVPLPFVVAVERIPMVESALARLNHMLVLPGFHLNHTTGRVYFRIVIPRHMDGTAAFEEIERAIVTALNTSQQYFAPLRDVATRDGDPAKLLDDVQLDGEHRWAPNHDHETLMTTGSIFGIGA